MTKKGTSVRRVKKVNVLIVILAIIFITIGIIMAVIAKDIFKKEEKVAVAEVVDKIDSYGYYKTDRSTKYFNELYEKLKAELQKETVDEKEYASLVAQLFAADFYDLDSKVSKTDVGGVQFIYDKFQETFTKKASDSEGMYYYLKSDVYGDRKQTLPKVKSVEIKSNKTTTFSNKSFKDEKAYEISLAITYETDLGYPKNVTVILVHNDKKLEIVEVK